MHATGALSATANASEKIESGVGAGSMAVAAGFRGGVALAGAGVEATNNISAEVKAYIDNDGTGNTVNAASVTLTATDASSISSVAASASLAASLGGQVGVSVSIGASIARNVVDNDVQAYIDNANVTTSSGGVTIGATQGAQPLFTLTGITAAQLDDVATADPNNTSTTADEAAADASGITLATPITVTVVTAGSKWRATDNGGKQWFITKSGSALNVSASDGGAVFFVLTGVTDTELTDMATVDTGSGAAADATGDAALKTTLVSQFSTLTAALSDATLRSTLVTRFAAGSITLTTPITVTTITAGSAWKVTDANNRSWVITMVGSDLKVSGTTIHAVTVAASLSVAIGPTGVALSGAGADATNVVLGHTNAFIEDSTVTSAGAVALAAAATSVIDSTIVAATAAVGAGGTAGLGAAIGAALARNLIGYNADGTAATNEVQAFIRRATVTAKSGVSLSAVTAQTIDAVVVAASLAVASGAIGGGFAGSGASAINKVAMAVRAYVGVIGTATTITGAGDFTATADDTSAISAAVGAGSLAATFGAKGAALAIGASIARNTIGNTVEAYVVNATVGPPAPIAVTGITAADLDDAAVTDADDPGTTGTNEATADATGDATIISGLRTRLGAAGTTLTGTLTLTRLSATQWRVREGSAITGTPYLITLVNGAFQLAGPGGSVRLDAREAASIYATSTAVSIAVAITGIAGLALSGAGAEGTNVISNVVKAYIDTSTVTAGGAGDNDVSVTASTSSTITAIVGAVSIAGSGGTFGAVAGSVGVSLARNLIGYTSATDTTGLDNQVLAYITSSTVIATRDVRVAATTTDRISTVSYAGSVAIAAAIDGIAASGAGAEATSKIGTKAWAYVTDTPIAAGRHVEVLSTADSQITKSLAIGVSLAATIAAAVSVSASIARNVIANSIQAYMSATSARTVSAGGHVSVLADVTHADIKGVQAVAVSTAVSLGAGLAGGGVDIDNDVDNTVSAYISGTSTALMTIGSFGNPALKDGNTKVAASEAAHIDSSGTGVSVGIAIAGGAITVGLNSNEIKSAITAYIAYATVVSDNTFVSATSVADIPTTNSTVAAAAILAAGTGNRSTAKIDTLVSAYIDHATLLSASDVSVTALSTNTAHADASGGSGGALAAGAMIAEALLGRGDSVDEVLASVKTGSVIVARTVRVSATSIDDLLATSVVGGAGLVAGLGSDSKTDTDQATLAKLEDTVRITTGALVMTSSHGQKVDSSADAYAFGLAVGSGAGATNENTSKANIAIGSAQVRALNIAISAANTLVKDVYKDASNLRSGSASLVGLTVLLSKTDIGLASAKFQANIDISSGALLSVEGSVQSPGALTIDALTDVVAVDKIRVEAVSGFSITAAESQLNTQTSAAINVTGAILTNKTGDVTLATRSHASVNTSASLLVGGSFSAAAGAAAKSRTNSTQAISISGATLSGRNVRLYAGRASNGTPNLFDSFADVQMAVASVFPNLGVPLPSAYVTNTNTVTISGASRISALQDVDLHAFPGNSKPDTTGQILSLSLVPYGSPAIKDRSTTNTDTVNIGTSATIEAGLNAVTAVLVKPSFASVTLTSGTAIGATSFSITGPLANLQTPHVGDEVTIGTGSGAETVIIRTVSGTGPWTITFGAPSTPATAATLANTHSTGDAISVHRPLSYYTTVHEAVAANASSFRLATPLAGALAPRVGDLVTLGTGDDAETVVVLTVSGSGPWTITFARTATPTTAGTLAYAHAAGAVVSAARSDNDDLTNADKTILGAAPESVTIPTDVLYHFAALNLDAIVFTVTTGTVVHVVAGANGGGDVGAYYQYRPITANGDAIVLETENYANTTRWYKLDDSHHNATATEGEHPSIAEAISSGFYESDVTKTLKANLAGKFLVIKPESLDAPTLSYQNIGSLLFEQREKIVDWIASHADNAEAVARYQVQLQIIEQQIAQLGLSRVVTQIASGNVISHDGRLYRYSGSTTGIVLAEENYANTALWTDVTTQNPTVTYPSNTTVGVRLINKQLDGIFVGLPSIYAAPGSIFVEADPSAATTTALTAAITGNMLKARSGARITIANATPFGMQVDDVLVKDSKRVTLVNGTLVIQQPGSVYFNSVVVGAAGSSCVNPPGTGANCPTITISQHFTPPAPTGVTVPPTDRDIYFLGDVINETGAVTINNRDGSISVSGEIRGATVNIGSARDFSLNTDDWLHTGRDPRQYIDLDYQRQLSIAARQVYASASSVLSAATGGTSLNSSINADNSKILALGRIAITARFLNINGTIQSGAQTITLNIAANFGKGAVLQSGQTVVLDVNTNQKYVYTGSPATAYLTLPSENFTNTSKWTPIFTFMQAKYGFFTGALYAVFTPFDYRSDYAGTSVSSLIDEDGNPVPGVDFGTAGIPVNGSFDAAKGEIVLDDIVSRGGEIVLAGQILSTGNGRLNVAYGYTGVSITNNSPYKLVLNRVDVTTNRIGRITIVDSGSLTKDVYEVSGSGTVTHRHYTGALQTAATLTGSGDAVVTGINYTLQSTTTSGTTGVTYSPQAGLQYMWVEGQASTVTTVTKYEQNSFNLFGDNDFADLLQADGGWEWRNQFFTDKQPLLESEVLACSTTSATCRVYGADQGVDVFNDFTTVFSLTNDASNGNRYIYVGSSAHLLLPDQNYLDTTKWQRLEDFLVDRYGTFAGALLFSTWPIHYLSSFKAGDAPTYANGQAYTIDHLQKANELVKVTGGVTIVRVNTGQKPCSTCTVLTAPKYYQHTGNAIQDIRLPDENYTNTTNWTEIPSSSASACTTSTTGPTCYDSRFLNYSYTIQTWTTGGGWLRSKTNHTLTTVVQGIKDYYTHTLKADLPIALGFLAGPTTPSINVTSTGDIVLQGNIQLPTKINVVGGVTIVQVAVGERPCQTCAPLTAAARYQRTGAISTEINLPVEDYTNAANWTDVTSTTSACTSTTGPTCFDSRYRISGTATFTTPGTIIQAETAAFLGVNPTLNATKGVRAAVETTGDEFGIQPLNITSDADIVVSGVNGDFGEGILYVGRIISNNGSVYISWRGGISAMCAQMTGTTCTQTSLIKGNRIELEAISGAIGAYGDPLLVDSDTQGTGGVAAVARGSIVIKEMVGDLKLIAPTKFAATASILSTTGHVKLETVSGSILDAFYESLPPKTLAEATAYRNALVTFFGNSTMTIDLSSIQYPLSVSLLRYLYPQTSLSVTDSAGHSTELPSSAASAETPNVVGSTVTLIAGGSGAVGRLSAITSFGMTTGFAGLNDTQRELLSRATIDDIVGLSYALYRYKGAGGSVNLTTANYATDTANWEKVSPTFTRSSTDTQSVALTQNTSTVLVELLGVYGLYLFLGGSGTVNLATENFLNGSRWRRLTPDFESDDGAQTLGAGVALSNTGVILVADTTVLDRVTVQLTDDVNVESDTDPALGNVTVKVDAGSGVALETSGNLDVDHITSGSGGDVRLTVGGAITDLVASGTSAAVTTFGSLRISAGSNVGTVTVPLRIRVATGGGLTILRSSSFSVNQISGDVTIGSTTKTISSLSVPLARADTTATIRVASGDLTIGNVEAGTSISLTAVTGSILDGLSDTPTTPGNITSRTQTMTISGAPTGGTFTLTFTDANGSQTTTALQHNATADAVQTALATLTKIGDGNVVVSLTGSVYTVRFTGRLTDPQRLLTATSSLTGGTSPAIAVTQPLTLALNAGSGIGTSTNPLDISVLGNVTALAASNIFLRNRLTLAASSITSTAGNITLTATGDINLGLVSSVAGTATLTATGSILEAGTDATSDFSALNGVLDAPSGIGTAANPIETDLTKLEARSVNGGIWLRNLGALTIGGIGTFNGVSAAGIIDIQTVGTLTVSEAVDSAGQPVTLVAPIDVAINAAVTSGGAAVTVTAGRNVSFSSTGSVDIESASSTVSITADSDNTGGGAITMADGSSINGRGGFISLVAKDQIQLSSLTTTTDVLVNSTAASVVDIASETSPTAADVTAANALLKGATGVGTSTNALELAVTKLEGTAGTGGFFVADASGLTIGGISSSNLPATTGISGAGAISVTTTGFLTLVENVASTGNAVTLQAIDSSAVTAANVPVPDALLPASALSQATSASDSSTTDEDLIVMSGADVSAGTIASLLAGDDMLIDTGSLITGGTQTILRSDHSDADTTTGSRLDVLGGLVAPEILITGGPQSDVLYLHPESLNGHVQLLGATDSTAAVADTLILDQLPNLDTTRRLDPAKTGPGALVTGNETTPLRYTVDVDGRGGADQYVVNTSGTTDYLARILDTGAASDGADVLTINGTSNADLFLLRANFVARLQPLSTVGAYERINYDDRINVLRVNGRDGNDEFYSDDNSALTTLDGGVGNDIFKFGQLFGEDRDSTPTFESTAGTALVKPNDTVHLASGYSSLLGQAGSTYRYLGVANTTLSLGTTNYLDTSVWRRTDLPTVAPGDDATTVETTRGFLTVGISFSTTAYGGDNSDTFVVYSNHALLKLFGENGNDEFSVRAFLLKSTGQNDSDETVVNGGAGDDHVEYYVNAAVRIDGGQGADSVVVIGSEGNDNFVVTKTGAIGNGLNVGFTAVERLDVDGQEGNDTSTS